MYPDLVFSTTFLKLLMSNIQVTRLAANQLVMIQASTSLILRNAFKSPGIAPQTAPAKQPPTKAMIQISHARDHLGRDAQRQHQGHHGAHQILSPGRRY